MPKRNLKHITLEDIYNVQVKNIQSRIEQN